MTKQSMAYLVEGLATAGYLEVSPDPADGPGPHPGPGPRRADEETPR